MPYTFSSPVNASVETIWSLLVDKIENPQPYVPEVEESRVLERYEDGIMREMITPLMSAKERIRVNNPTPTA